MLVRYIIGEMTCCIIYLSLGLFLLLEHPLCTRLAMQACGLQPRTHGTILHCYSRGIRVVHRETAPRAYVIKSTKSEVLRWLTRGKPVSSFDATTRLLVSTSVVVTFSESLYVLLNGVPSNLLPGTLVHLVLVRIAANLKRDRPPSATLST